MAPPLVVFVRQPPFSLFRAPCSVFGMDFVMGGVMFKREFILLILLIIGLSGLGQRLGFTFQDTTKYEITVKHLDSIYKEAIWTETSEGVFETEEEVEALIEAFTQLRLDLGTFLLDNHFNWEKETQCFNRVYFSPAGKIDYFLFNFLGNPDEKPSPESQKEFERLLNLFIQDYQFSLTAKVKFVQCGMSLYLPKE